MGTMDSIKALIDHSVFKYFHGCRFLGQSKVFVLKMSMDFLRSSVALVMSMQVSGDMEKS